MGLIYRFGHDITDRMSLVSIDNESWTVWKNGVPDFRYTIRDEVTLNNMITRAPRGFAAAYVDGTPAVFLKAMIRHTGGINENIPRTYDELTGSGTWETFYDEGDTVFMVTYTLQKEFRGYQIGDEKLAHVALKRFKAEYVDREFLLTTSPLTIRAAKLHYMTGAMPVMRLENARPGFLYDMEPVGGVIVWGHKWPRHDESLFDFMAQHFNTDIRSHGRRNS